MSIVKLFLISNLSPVAFGDDATPEQLAQMQARTYAALQDAVGKFVIIHHFDESPNMETVRFECEERFDDGAFPDAQDLGFIAVVNGLPRLREEWVEGATIVEVA